MFLYLVSLKSVIQDITANDVDGLHSKAKEMNVFMYLYSQKAELNSEIFEEVINTNKYDDIYVARLDCSQNNDICQSHSDKLPLLTKIFPDKRFDFRIQSQIQSQQAIKDFITENLHDNSSHIGGNFNSIRSNPVNGGTAFHLRASASSDILKLYRKISKLYNNQLYHITFAFTVSKKKIKPTLTAYYSKFCVKVFKLNDLDLFDIIYNNRFSHFRYFERQEFLDLVNKSSGMVFLIPDNNLNDDFKTRIHEANKITCGRFVSGWTRRRETHLGRDFDAFSEERADVAIVNRETDGLFIVSMRMAMNDYIYYVKDALTNTRGWKYPKNSTKVIEIHYRKAAIVISIITAIFFAALLYSSSTHGT